METIKLKVLDKAGHTRMTCEAAEAVSLVYTSAYQPGDRIALEILSLIHIFHSMGKVKTSLFSLKDADSIQIKGISISAAMRISSR